MAKYRLGDVAPILQGTPPMEYPCWLLNLDMVESNTGRILEYVYVQPDEIGSSTVSFDINNVLYSKLRPYLNKVVLPDRAGFATSEMLPLRPDTTIITREYLTYFLRSPHFVGYINNKTSGAKMPRANTSDLKAVEIDCPSLERQNAIIGVFEHLTSIIDLYQRQLLALDTLIKARFVEMFGAPVSNNMGWRTGLMDDVAPAVNYMGKFEGKVWLLNLDMVEAQTGRVLDYNMVDENEIGNSTCTFDRSNVLYSKLRPYLNKVVIPDRCGYATSEFVPLQPLSSVLNREYLAFMLRSDEFVKMINEKVAGAKMPRVSMGDFRRFKVPLPPINLQEQFATFVSQVDKSKVVVQEAMNKAQLLLDSLMQQYFG